MHNIYSIEKIEAEAAFAAVRFSDVNDACPYPFESTAGYVFKNAFNAARMAIQKQAAPQTVQAQPATEGVAQGAL